MGLLPSVQYGQTTGSSAVQGRLSMLSLTKLQLPHLPIDIDAVHPRGSRGRPRALHLGYFMPKRLHSRGTRLEGTGGIHGKRRHGG